MGLPLQERDPRGRSDPGRQRDPGHEPDASGRAGSYAVQRDRPSGLRHRPGQGQGAAEAGQRHGLRDQVPVPDRRPDLGQGQGRDRQGSDRGRLQGHPGADHDGELRRGTRQHHGGHQRPLGGLVLRLAVGLDLAAAGAAVRRTRTRPTRSGPTTRRSATRRPTPRWTRSRRCRWRSRRLRGTTWTSRSPQKYFPLFTTYYTGIAQAHGSKIKGDNDDNTLGMPTWKDIWVSQ